MPRPPIRPFHTSFSMLGGGEGAGYPFLSPHHEYTTPLNLHPPSTHPVAMLVPVCGPRKLFVHHKHIFPFIDQVVALKELFQRLTTEMVHLRTILLTGLDGHSQENHVAGKFKYSFIYLKNRLPGDMDLKFESLVSI